MATLAEKRAAGIKAILYFHDQASIYGNYPFKNNVQGLYDQIDGISPDWLKNFGNAIIITKMDEAPWYSSTSVCQTNMEELANTLQGKAPATSEALQLFYDSIEQNFSSIVAQIKQIGQGVFSDSAIAAKDVYLTASSAVTGYLAFKTISLVAGVALIGYQIYKFIGTIQPKQNPKRKKSNRK